MKKLNILFFVIIVITIVISYALFAPEHLGDIVFWQNLGWIIFLAFINWAVSSYFFFNVGNKDSQSAYGGLPSLSIIVFIYSLLSVILLLISWVIPHEPYGSNWHLVSQVVLLGIASSIFVMILISVKGAEVPKNDTLPSKESLIKHIAVLTKKSPHKDSQYIKYLNILGETISYSMPHITRINDTQKYMNLARKISELDAVGLEDTPKLINDIRDLIRIAESL